jgi:hypothetical protein
MKLEQHDNLIVIRETPGCMWFVGLFFLVICGMFLFGASGGFSNWNELKHWEISVAIAMSFCGIAAGIWMIQSAPVTKVFIDRQQKQLSIVRRALFGRESKTYEFDEIDHFFVFEETDQEGSLVYSLAVRLMDEEVIKINSMQLHDEHYHHDFAFRANEFMLKQLPATAMILDLTDEESCEIN